MALTDISFIFLILLNNIRFASYARRLLQKRIVLKNHIKKSIEDKLCGILHSRIKGSSLLYKNSAYKSKFYLYEQQSSLR